MPVNLLPIAAMAGGLLFVLGSLFSLGDPGAGLPAALVAALVELSLLSLLLRIVAPGSPDVARLVLVAALVRIGGAILLHSFPAVEAAFAPDAPGYDAGGRALAESWQGLGSAEFVWRRRGILYYILVGIQYFLGHFPLIPKITNSVLGAVAVLYVWRIGSFLWNEEVGWNAASLVAFFPSLVLWSCLNIRDSLAILLICMITWHAISLKQGLSIPSILMLLLSLVGLGLVRDYLFLILSVAVLAGLFLTSAVSAPRSLALFGIVGVIIFLVHQQTQLGSRFIEDVSLSEMQRLREGSGAGASSRYLEDFDISTPGGLLLFLPAGLVYFLWSPFPWQVAGIRQVLPLPEMLVWYWLTPAAFIGMRELVRRNYHYGVVPITIALGLIVSYGLGSSNVGTAFRHRGQVMPILLTMAAIGLAVRRERTESQSIPRTTKPERLVWGPDGRPQWIEN